MHSEAWAVSSGARTRSGTFRTSARPSHSYACLLVRSVVNPSGPTILFSSCKRREFNPSPHRSYLLRRKRAESKQTERKPKELKIEKKALKRHGECQPKRSSYHSSISPNL